jgi:hypothetical protein
MPKTQSMKELINLNFIKIKNFYSAKRMKSQTTDHKKICENTSDKELASKNKLFSWACL